MGKQLMKKYQIPFLIFLGMLLWGLVHTEYLIVYLYAKLLCLSCIGIQ